MNPNEEIFKNSQAMFARAARVIPGGIYGHTTPGMMVAGAFPYYAQRAQGARYWDIDGHEYIDYMCGYGPMILGYQHPEIEEAVERQRKNGNCFNHPTSLMVELAELLVELVDFADWSVFGVNGSDMTDWAVQVARQHTGRKKILRVAGSYHGIGTWCTPGHGGLIPEDRMHVHTFPWNDTQALEDLVRRYKDQIAAIITAPIHHPVFQDSVLPQPGFLQFIETCCKQNGIIFILDDVRSGFRLHLGGSHRYFGFEPDLICFCKALGNGYPISATLGRKDLRLSASKVFLTGSFWNGAFSMAATLACLKILQRDRLIEQIHHTGEKLCSGLKQAARRHNLAVTLSGHPSMPLMSFTNEKNLFQMQKFCVESVQRGVFFHPHHNWFLSAAHTDSDVEQTLQVADQAFAAVRQSFGEPQAPESHKP